MALMDIDHFKQVNDTHGHHVGDAVIHQVSSLLNRHARSVDSLFRWGGEEFLMLMPGTSLTEARDRLEALRSELNSCPLQVDRHESEPTNQLFSTSDLQNALIAVNLSIGLTMLQEGETSSSLLKRVDHLMLAAKRAGRNRIESDAAIIEQS